MSGPFHKYSDHGPHYDAFKINNIIMFEKWACCFHQWKIKTGKKLVDAQSKQGVFLANDVMIPGHFNK